VNIDDIVISPHAIDQFKRRYKDLNGVVLIDETELMEKLSALIAQAVPEEESPALESRRQFHGGIGTYFVSPPWRFVFSENNKLETCEIVPQEIFLVKNPHIPNYLVKTRLFIKIKLDRRRLLTKITKDKKTLHLQNLIEINAVIRALRALGLRVNQQSETNRLEIVVPQDIGVYWLEQFAKPENVMISLGRTDSFPLGRQRISCPGILKLDLERVLNFLQINKSH